MALPVCVVTGAAAGIGAAIATAAAERGHHVIVSDLDLGAAEETAARIGAAGHRATAIKLDMSDREAIVNVLDRVHAEFGPIRSLVNNSGIGQLIPFEDLSLEEWEQTLAVNVTGALVAAQHVARLMKETGGGRIVNVASISGERASPGRVAYGTSKACMLALTRQLATELAPINVQANCILPGPVETELARSIPAETRAAYEAFVPAERFASVEEIGGVAAYLLCDAPDFLTGANIAVDGGFLASGLGAGEEGEVGLVQEAGPAPRRADGRPVALVTGGARGIGFATALTLCADGHAVVLADRDEEAAHAAAQRLGAQGFVAEAAGLDVGDPEACRATVGSLVGSKGRLDVLVNNAAVGGVFPFLEMPLAEWDKVRAVNLTGPFALTKAAAPHMRAQGFGRIVSLSSVSGLRAAYGRTAYGLAKAGLIAMSRQFAIELASSGVTVNVVAPGPIETDMARELLTPEMKARFISMVPAGRMGEPANIADAIRFLASPEASFVTGQTLAVDGGYSVAGLGASSLVPRPESQMPIAS
ncbi:MAG: glucose 1-dehydrogenase [Roseitalea sp.]|jgi:NAD(P)-dependent dehydrogenase (short-subunit alcohol dehydrogenase family)|nr:glucose 1-dehydrogenase [Roseitalea sp.]MBO6722051.1 glucose 1-dehydrogenase [Roseitalea sp.]MBO6741671.1 glucose 1-dehydrogenase [Roseitalea sp.]